MLLAYMSKPQKHFCDLTATKIGLQKYPKKAKNEKVRKQKKILQNKSYQY